MTAPGFLTFVRSFVEFIHNPVPLTVFAVAVVIAWPIGHLIAKRCRRSRTAAALLVAAVGFVVALTLTPDFDYSPAVPLPPHYLTLIDNPRVVWAQLIQPPSDAEQVANILFFVPVGLFAGWFWKSVVRASLFGLALTVTIETCQYDIPGRAGSFTDIRNNTLGAIAGALLAATAYWTARLFRASRGAPRCSNGTSRPAP
jgi:hypothetical protein